MLYNRSNFRGGRARGGRNNVAMRGNRGGYSNNSDRGDYSNNNEHYNTTQQHSMRGNRGGYANHNDGYNPRGRGNRGRGRGRGRGACFMCSSTQHQVRDCPRRVSNEEEQNEYKEENACIVDIDLEI